MSENNRGIKLERRNRTKDGRGTMGHQRSWCAKRRRERARARGSTARGNYIYKWQFSKTKDFKIARFIRELLRKNRPSIFLLVLSATRITPFERKAIVDEQPQVYLISHEENEQSSMNLIGPGKYLSVKLLKSLKISVFQASREHTKCK